MSESKAVANYSFADMERLANSMAKSGLFGVKTADQALSLMALSQATGMHPAQAVQEYHIIEGRPSLKSEVMLSRFQAAGGKVDWLRLDDTVAEAAFSHPQGGSVTINWDMARAEQAGLAKRQNWQKYPRAMLRSRVVSEGVRTVFPGATGGLYTPEEVVDMVPEALTVEPLPAPSKMSDDEAAEFMLALGQAADLEALRQTFMHCYQKAKATGDAERIAMFTACKDRRKMTLEAEDIPVEEPTA
jgi:hypothetical protein